MRASNGAAGVSQHDRSFTVAHLLETYLTRTETFIYRYLTSFQRVRPVVFANVFERLEEFPITHRHVWRHRRLTPSWLAQRTGERLVGIDPLFAYWKRRHDLRLLHAHFGPTGCLALPHRKQTGLPLVTSFYGYDASMYARSSLLHRFDHAYEFSWMHVAVGEKS